MVNVIFPSDYLAISQSRYLIRQLEEPITQVNSSKTFSIFNLLKQYYLTEEEKKTYLKNKSFLDRLHFYLIGNYQKVNEKISDRIEHDTRLKNLLIEKMEPLKPRSEVYENIANIFEHKKNLLKVLQSANTTGKAFSMILGTFSVLWLTYNLRRSISDWSTHCNAETNEPTIAALDLLKCPRDNLFNYFYNLNSEFFTLPILVGLGSIIQFYDNEILSRIFFSPLERVKESALAALENISKVKDFLIDKATDPDFKKSTFQKEKIG